MRIEIKVSRNFWDSLWSPSWARDIDTRLDSMELTYRIRKAIDNILKEAE